MRADRLLRLLLTLQGRGRHTIPALARRLEVSERTVHRDLEALSTAGVPVVATRGVKGGVSLVEGWRTEVAGLTRSELHALAAIGSTGALGQLGLSGPLRSGILKVAASLPELQRASLEHAQARLLVDTSGWFGGAEEVPHLETLRSAAWQDVRVRLTYADFDGKRTTRVVEPYALVMKANRWYLVAGEERGPAVFRVSRIERARALEETFTRPEEFALEPFWADWCRRFGEKRATYDVTMQVTDAGAAVLASQRPPADRARLEGRGNRRVTIDFERESIALSQLATIGAGVEVLEPAPLRARLVELARGLAETYRPRAARRR